MPLRNLAEDRLVVNLRTPLGQRGPRLQDRAMASGDIQQVIPLLQGMNLALVHSGDDLVVYDQVEVALWRKIRDTDRADGSLLVQILQGPPRAVVVVERLVQQIQVHVAQAEPAQ